MTGNVSRQKATLRERDKTRKEMILYYEKTRLQRVGLRAKDWC